MQPDEHEQVALALETLIRETQATIARVEQHGLDIAMPEDYQALLDSSRQRYPAAARAYNGDAIERSIFSQVTLGLKECI